MHINFVVFVLATSLVVAIEIMVWRRLTPNLIAVLPCFVVVMLAALVTPYFGFVEPVADLYLVLSVFFGVGCVGSLLVAFLFRGYEAVYAIRPTFDVQGGGVGWLRWFLVIACLVAAFKAYEAYLAVGNLHDEAFSEMLSRGVAGHSLLFGMVAAPVLFFLSRKGDWISLAVVVSAFILFFLKQVKSWFVIPVLFCFFMYWYSGRLRVDGRGGLKIFLLLFLMVVMFFSVYLLGWASRAGFQLSSEYVYSALEAISVHFLGYLVSGVLGFSELIRSSIELSGVDGQYLVAPLYNILAVVQGEAPMSVVSDGFFSINELHGKGSNVYTFWGTLLFRVGSWSLLIYLFLVMFLTVLMVMLSRNRLVFFVYCYFVSFMAVGWFEYYYFHLAVYEGVIFLMAISVFLGGRRMMAAVGSGN